MNIKKFLSKIYSVTDYKCTHNLIKICGIKIKIAKKEFADKKIYTIITRKIILILQQFRRLLVR